MNKGDLAIVIASAMAFAVLLAITPIYNAGFKDGMAAANGVCKITCESESKESKEIRSIIEKKTLEALKK